MESNNDDDKLQVENKTVKNQKNLEMQNVGNIEKAALIENISSPNSNGGAHGIVGDIEDLPSRIKSKKQIPSDCPLKPDCICYIHQRPQSQLSQRVQLDCLSPSRSSTTAKATVNSTGQRRQRTLSSGSQNSSKSAKAPSLSDRTSRWFHSLFNAKLSVSSPDISTANNINDGSSSSERPSKEYYEQKSSKSAYKKTKKKWLSGLLPGISSISIHSTSQLPELALSEIQKHNKINDCWLIVHEKVYNISAFVKCHPAGPDTIMRRAGQDATQDFYFHSREAQRMWRDRMPIVGVVDEEGMKELDRRRRGSGGLWKYRDLNCPIT